MKYRLNDEKVFSDVTDGIAILIEMESGVYFGMNLLSTKVYENIVNGADTEELLSEMAKAKGFSEVLAVIGDNDINIVVRGSSLTAAQTLQIQDIAAAQSGYTSDKIKILTVQ